ncbi:MAG: hypothetical protein MI921_16975 [Cytophagales bacterium]|nr:hypothetical protein [Cytophagales bacterium]
MSKIYALDEAINRIFDDRDYYLSLNEIDRAKMRVYKQRFLSKALSLDGKISLVKKYGAEVTVDIRVKFK